MSFIVGIDQSTQGTKALLYDERGKLLLRVDRAHAQIVNEKGWVEHDPEEIYRNTLYVVQKLLADGKVDREKLKAVGISNQRETAVCWNKRTGVPVHNAIVWQCARGEEICRRLQKDGEIIRETTGLPLSPYFSAAKLSWIMEHVNGVREQAGRGDICCGTVDSWLVYKLTGGGEFRTDYSNASRTQLFDIRKLRWDDRLCGMFGIPPESLAVPTDSNGFFGETDFGGLLNKPIPIHGVMGDSHGALYGQGCLRPGMMKATYGTGSSIMMNVGPHPLFSGRGLVTSLAWRMDGEAQYVLEGNINYAGAVVTWLKELGLVESEAHIEQLAREAHPQDRTCLVPAFSGLGAPYWRSDVSAMFYGMSRTTGRAELARAGLACIAHQIADIVALMTEEVSVRNIELRADGGPTKNRWLMQFQSDLLDCPVRVSEVEELSGTGAAYATGIGVGVYREEELFSGLTGRQYSPDMDEKTRRVKLADWKHAVRMLCCAGTNEVHDNEKA